MGTCSNCKYESLAVTENPCRNCDDYSNFQQKEVEFDDVKLQNIYNYGKAFVDACEYADITNGQGLRFLERFSKFKLN